MANFPILTGTDLFSRSLEMLNNPSYTPGMNTDLWINKVAKESYNSCCIQCQSNGQPMLPRMFITLYGLMDNLRICDDVEAHDEVYIIALINRSLNSASSLSKEDRFLKPLCGIL
jgi:hypothetical protein